MANDGPSDPKPSLLAQCIERFSTESPTPEGLTVHVSERDGRLWVQEIGGDGFVIYEFEVVDPVGADSANDVVTLLERLHELEERCKTLSTESSTPLELAVCRRN